MNTSFNSTANPILSAIGRSWWVVLLYGLAAVGFGIIAFMQPVAAAAALIFTFGLLALFDAGVSLVALFGSDNFIPKGWLILYTILSGLFGVLAVMNPVAMAGSMLLVLAIWLIVAGIYRIVLAIRIRKVIEGEWWMILSGVLGILLGVLFLAEPLAGVVATTLWIAVLALIYGVFQIWAAFKLRKLATS